MMENKTETAIFGGGCFWCTEAIFLRLRGVVSVMPGYAGGDPPAGGENPSYYDVSEGTTGHAEVIKIEFDPKVISFEDLLDVFFHTHDPTTLNKQGNDTGTQYRSVILYTSDEQKEKVEKAIPEFQKEFAREIVTQIIPLGKFYDAEEYHRNYYEKNEYQPYCQLIIAPKIKKLLEKYGDKVKH